MKEPEFDAAHLSDMPALLLVCDGEGQLLRAQRPVDGLTEERRWDL